MPSITAWTRLEPRVRRDDPAIALEARVHDPLWLLARQWQVGEFAAEDAGSPLQVQARIERAPLTRYLPGAPTDETAGVPYDPAHLPLETLVERESIPMDRRLACEAGLRFLRLLDSHDARDYGPDFVAQYPLLPPSEGNPVDPETARLLRLASGRVPDGARLAADLRASPGELPASLPIEAEDREKVRRAVDAWLAWLHGRAPTSPEGATSAWVPERLEYVFAVAAPTSDGERVLVAPEYANGYLDWHSFDQDPAAAIGAADDAAAHQGLVRTAIPAPVTYRGMPVARWWEFEDGQVNFSAIDAGPSDLLRLLLLEFALDYGNDWFLVPVELPVGALYRVTSLIVTDSFGARTLVRPYTDVQSRGSHWRMFTMSAQGEADIEDDNLLFLPPSLPQGLESAPIEELLLVRDEVANVGWAVERRVEDAGGRPLDRFEQYQRDRPSPISTEAESSVDGDLRYRLATTVPDYWLPLVPTRVDPDRPDVRLARGRVLVDGSTAPAAPPPLGRLLEPGRPLQIFEEEVPRSGARVTRSYQYVRWTDGSSHLWIGRRKGTGRGEGASGIRFDSLEKL